MPELKSHVTESIWGNVEPSINGYSKLVQMCLDRMSKEQCRELLASMRGCEYEPQPEALCELKEKNPDNPDRRIPLFVEADADFLSIRPEGYGEAGAADGHGQPILLEIWEGKLRVIVFADINQQDPTHIISMEAARESNRSDTLLHPSDSVTNSFGLDMDSAELADQQRQIEKFSPPPEDDE